MQYFITIIFVLNGCIFFLISTVFYPAISQRLISLQENARLTVPQFWNLPLVLGIVRIIFVIVGIFLVAFGIAFIWLKRMMGF